MKQPFMKLHPVFESNYAKRTKDIIIFQYYENSAEQDREYCPHCNKKGCNGKCFYYEWNDGDKDQPATPNLQLSSITLQSLIDMLPEGVKPSDVKISISSDNWAGVPYNNITFFYKKTFPKDIEQYKKDKAAYDVEWKEYEKKKALYDEWLRKQEIKKLEKQLQSLKK